jgi:hypothetical protein
LTATSLEPPKKSSTYLSGYASGFFVVSASFRQNSQNAHDGTIFHHPASGAIGAATGCAVCYHTIAGCGGPQGAPNLLILANLVSYRGG